MTSRVASGVTSEGANPVPPVVSTRSHPSASQNRRRATEIRARSSGTSSVAAISAPSSRAKSASAGPLWSSAGLVTREVLTVRIAARKTPSLALAAHVVVAAAGLLEQRELVDRDAPLDPLHHVVDRQRSDRARGERLHLDSGR